MMGKKPLRRSLFFGSISSKLVINSGFKMISTLKAFIQNHPDLDPGLHLCHMKGCPLSAQ